jgi:rSAM/selenodomain-associated transferase 2
MISIIIPVLNEEENIPNLIPYLKGQYPPGSVEIIVVDGGSTDRSVNLARMLGAKVITSVKAGRAAQMNCGASMARNEILYFIHSDAIPPETFYSDIVGAVFSGYAIGRYRTKFDGGSRWLDINAFFTRFDWFICYGGDQTMFITKTLFQKINGFNDQMVVMEDYDLVKRARQYSPYKIFKGTTLVSTRKYKNNSWLRVQYANLKVIIMNILGVSQAQMLSAYRKALHSVR